MRGIKTLANTAGALMWKTLLLLLFCYFQVMRKARLSTIRFHWVLCLDFTPMPKAVFLVIQKHHEKKIWSYNKQL